MVHITCRTMPEIDQKFLKNWLNFGILINIMFQLSGLFCDQKRCVCDEFFQRTQV